MSDTERKTGRGDSCALWFLVGLGLAITATAFYRGFLVAGGLALAWITVRTFVPVFRTDTRTNVAGKVVSAVSLALSIAAWVALVSCLFALRLPTFSAGSALQSFSYRLLEHAFAPSVLLAFLALAVAAAAKDRTTRASARLAFAASGIAFLTSAGLPFELREQGSSRKIACLSNVKDLVMAMTLYVNDNDQRFPPATTWSDAMLPHVEGKQGFLCPEAPGIRSAFAYNAAVSSAMYGSVTDAYRLVTIFESDRGWNAAGGPELLTDEPRHFGGDDLGFADGHAAWHSRAKVVPNDPKGGWRKAYPEESHLQWKP